MSEELLIVDACTDEPRASDFKYSDVFGDVEGEDAEGATPKKRPDNAIIYNQGANSKTLKACTRFGIMHIINAQNINEFKGESLSYPQEDPSGMWFRYQQSRGRPNTGSSLQSALDQSKREGYISGYVVCNTEQEMKKAIDNGCYIYTGSNKIDRPKTKVNGVAVFGGYLGHAFAIGKYDSKGFHSPNSYGEKGQFYIPYGNKNKLFTCYAIIDKDSSSKLQEYKFDNEFNQAIKAGITNGNDPEKPATRKQVAVMIYRATKK